MTADHVHKEEHAEDSKTYKDRASASHCQYRNAKHEVNTPANHYRFLAAFKAAKRPEQTVREDKEEEYRVPDRFDRPPIGANQCYQGCDPGTG